MIINVIWRNAQKTINEFQSRRKINSALPKIYFEIPIRLSVQALNMASDAARAKECEE